MLQPLFMSSQDQSSKCLLEDYNHFLCISSNYIPTVGTSAMQTLLTALATLKYIKGDNTHCITDSLTIDNSIVIAIVVISYLKSVSSRMNFMFSSDSCVICTVGWFAYGIISRTLCKHATSCTSVPPLFTGGNQNHKGVEVDLKIDKNSYFLIIYRWICKIWFLKIFFETYLKYQYTWYVDTYILSNYIERFTLFHPHGKMEVPARLPERKITFVFILLKHIRKREMSSFSDNNFVKKLGELNNTQQSIQTLSLWLIHHRKHSKTIVQVWLREMQKGNYFVHSFLVVDNIWNAYINMLMHTNNLVILS